MQAIVRRSVVAGMIAAMSLMVWAEGAPVPDPAAAGTRHEAVSVRLPSAAFAAMETINPEHIRWHVRFLSHDLLEGRGTGQRGGDIAAEYIATQFALDGLKPAGDDGTFFQNVPMVEVKTLPETSFSFVEASGKTIHAKNLEDIVTNNESQ